MCTMVMRVDAHRFLENLSFRLFPTYYLGKASENIFARNILFFGTIRSDVSYRVSLGPLGSTTPNAV